MHFSKFKQVYLFDENAKLNNVPFHDIQCMFSKTINCVGMTSDTIPLRSFIPSLFCYIALFYMFLYS